MLCDVFLAVFSLLSYCDLVMFLTVWTLSVLLFLSICVFFFFFLLIIRSPLSSLLSALCSLWIYLLLCLCGVLISCGLWCVVLFFCVLFALRVLLFCCCFVDFLFLCWRDTAAIEIYSLARQDAVRICYVVG